MVPEPENSLAVLEDEPTAAAVIHRGTEQANALMDVLRQAGKALQVTIGGRKYLRFEAWQTIAQFNRSSPVTEWTRPIVENDAVVGYEARVNVVDLDTGRVIAAGEGMCGLDEYVTQGQRTEIARRNAARSMAQTRAGAKALRMAYSFVAVLAGFEPTPAEEVDTSSHDPARTARAGTRPRAEQERPAPAASGTGDRYSQFFREARDLGYEPKAALAALEIATIADWLAQGKTIDEALGRLRARTAA